MRILIFLAALGLVVVTNLGAIQSWVSDAGKKPDEIALQTMDDKGSGGLKADPKVADSTRSKGKTASAEVKDKGIGPIKEVKLGPIDDKLVARGEKLFTDKCTVCHLMDTKKIGPPLRDVAKQQTPEFIMNMMLNTDGMEKKDAYVKKLISQYQTYMTILDLSNDDARALLEYLRSSTEKGAPK